MQTFASLLLYNKERMAWSEYGKVVTLTNKTKNQNNMKIIFNLEYQTSFGEQLVLNIVDEKGNAERRPMATHDGYRWTYEWNNPSFSQPSTDQSGSSKNCQLLNYYYSIERGDSVIRTEWMLLTHRMELMQDIICYNVYDRWTDIPEDAFLYSSAFVNLPEGNSILSPLTSSLTPHLLLKVRAPQLRDGDRLAVVGAPVYLGEWNPGKAIHMTEQQPNEWVALLDAARLPDDVELKFVILRDNGDVIWEEGYNRRLLLPEISKGEVMVNELQQAWFNLPLWKGAGTVIPVFSLRSEGSFGVGDFGDLKMMVDWCAKTGQRALQILPINDTTITHTWQDSYPYNSISIYALHPQYTDFRQLPDIKDEELKSKFEKLRRELNELPQIDYERVNIAKRKYLDVIFQQEWGNIKRRASFKKFFDDNRNWLEPYAQFSIKRDSQQSTADSQQQEDFWYFLQYVLDQQMHAAHDYARKKHVILKGDIPIGISRDGVEAAVEPRYFNMNGQAGAPPDAFSANGQNWGFPTYNWDEMLADGCQWWVRRFRKMAEYFDAYRIDHVLGFFRIWEIPIDSVHGLLGQFSPALAMTPEEIEAYGLPFNEQHMTRPFIANWTLKRMFGEYAAYVKEHFLDLSHDDIWQMKPEFDTQRKVEEWYKKQCSELSDFAFGDENTTSPNSKPLTLIELRDGLYSLISDVLFVRDRKDPNKFHPRIGVQNDFVYEALWDKDKDAFNRLYNDYFYRRNNQFWYNEAMKKLPRLTQATRMLVCAEDLGMVPDCVPWVINELRILSLEIQSMPKNPNVSFGILADNPYRSVCTISTHDMPTLRQWWDEDKPRTQSYYREVMGHEGEAPHPLSGELAKEVVNAHLMSPSMLCLLSLQDWLSIDEELRLKDENAERINIPANPRHYWRYRMHLTIERLMKADGLNQEISSLIKCSGR